MIISDISYLEIASDDNSVVGGLADADASALATASGLFFADTYANTFTSARSFFFNNSSVTGSISRAKAI